MKLLSNFHRVFARLHGEMSGEAAESAATGLERREEFKSAYAEYVSATAQANIMLQKYGADSPQFSNADVASMRLFHRVKKMQGLKKPRTG